MSDTIEEFSIQSHFRTQINDKVIASRIHTFAYWNEVQSHEIDVAFEMYQKGPYIQKRFAKINRRIRRGVEEKRFNK